MVVIADLAKQGFGSSKPPEGRWCNVKQAGVVLATLVVVAISSMLVPINLTPASAAVVPTFSVTPTRGPPGTAVDVQSITPCVPPSGATNWHVVIVVTDQEADDLASYQSLTATVTPS